MGNALTADAAAALGWHEARVRAPARAIASGPTFASAPTRPGAAQPAPALSRREKVLLIGFAVLLHAAALNAFNTPTAALPAVTPPEVPPLMIELTRPAPPPVLTPPEPVVKQPVVAPPPPVVPVVDEFATRPPPRKAPPPPKVAPKVVEPAPAPAPVANPAPPPPVPVAAAPAPAPAPVAATPPSAHADYLHNPAPEYPDFARRRGWEGTVVLRVRVRANGAPSEVHVEQSSGRDVLDTAARQAVARWTFVPAKRGAVAEEGWVSVPIGFSLS